LGKIQLGDIIKGNMIHLDYITNDVWRFNNGSIDLILESKINELAKIITNNSKVMERLEEADVKTIIVEPILSLLAYDYNKQGDSKEIPDYFLRKTNSTIERGAPFTIHNKIFDHMLKYETDGIVEIKAGYISLDTNSHGRTPSLQIKSYFQTYGKMSNDNICGGILSNGYIWRLYYKLPDYRVDYIEFDFTGIISKIKNNNELIIVESLVNSPDEKEVEYEFSDILRLFLFIFSSIENGNKEYDILLQTNVLFNGYEASKTWEKRIYDYLEVCVLDNVFPIILRNLSSKIHNLNLSTGDLNLDELYYNVLYFLFKILTVMYLEDNFVDLSESGDYYNFSLRKLRDKIQRNIDYTNYQNNESYNHHEYLLNLFSILDRGNKNLGIIGYYGDLFSPEKTSLIDRLQLSDKQLIKLIELLTKVNINGKLTFINYGKLSVSHLGSIYENLLNHKLILQNSTLSIRKESNKRKETGSYYTPDYIVGFIVENTLHPIFSQIEENLYKIVLEGQFDSSQHKDPIMEIFNLKILDPACGSGQFLIGSINYISNKLFDILDVLVDEGIYLPSFQYLVGNLFVNKSNQGKISGILQRKMIKTILFGIDVNDFAVDLCKLIIGLHTNSKEYPFPFLNHHFKIGNSLLGVSNSELSDIYGNPAFPTRVYKHYLDILIQNTTKLGNLMELDLQSVEINKELDRINSHLLTPLREALNVLLYSKIISNSNKSKALDQLGIDLLSALNDSDYQTIKTKLGKESLKLINEVNKFALTESIFHLQVEFPELMDQNYELNKKQLIILTNPPYGGKISLNKDTNINLLRDYISSKWFQGIKYKINSENCFLLNILDTCNYFGTIIPKSIAFYSTNSFIRNTLLKEFNLNTILDTKIAFNNVNTETIILCASKSLSNDNYVSIYHTSPKLFKPIKKIKYAGTLNQTLMQDEGFIITSFIPETSLSLLNIIKNNSIRIRELYTENEVTRSLYIRDEDKKGIIQYSTRYPNIKRSEDEFLFINKVPDITSAHILKISQINLHQLNTYRQVIIKKNLLLPKFFIKVLRGKKLVSFIDYHGQFIPTEKLVCFIKSIVNPSSQNSLDMGFISACINSSYTSYFIQNFVFSNTTETSRVMDYPYSSLIPIPIIDLSIQINEDLINIINDTKLKLNIEFTNNELIQLQIEIENLFRQILQLKDVTETNQFKRYCYELIRLIIQFQYQLEEYQRKLMEEFTEKIIQFAKNYYSVDCFNKESYSFIFFPKNFKNIINYDFIDFYNKFKTTLNLTSCNQELIEFLQLQFTDVISTIQMIEEIISLIYTKTNRIIGYLYGLDDDQIQVIIDEIN